MNKKLSNYFVMPSTEQYSIREEYILALIEMNSDSKVSHISRSKLCELSGINSADVLTKYTNKFQKDGHLKKVYTYKNGKKLVEYHLTDYGEYIIAFNGILQFGECAGLAFKLAELRLRGTSEIRMSNNQIIKKLGLTKPTYIKYRNQLLLNGVLIETDKGFALNTEYFPIMKAKISQQARSRINAILMDNNGSRAKKTLLTYYNPNTDEFEGLKGSIDDFLDYCLAGCPKKNKSQQEEKEIPQINF